MTAKLTWNPTAFNQRLLAAFAQSVRDAQRAAQLRNPAPTKVGVTAVQTGPTSAVLKTTGKLGPVFEKGRRAGYPIPWLRYQPRSGAKPPPSSTGRTGSGKFVGGAMAPKPFLRPASAAWAHGLYQRRGGCGDPVAPMKKAQTAASRRSEAGFSCPLPTLRRRSDERATG